MKVSVLVCSRCSGEWEYVKPNPRGGRTPTLCPPCKPIQAAERLAAWNAANRASTNASKRRWRLDNPAATKAARSAWEVAHPERRREYRRAGKKRNPEANRSHVRARKARQRSLTVVPFTPSQLRARLAYYGRCWICGGAPETIDHVKPLAAGGAHMLCNLRPACLKCNSRKGSKWPYQPT